MQWQVTVAVASGNRTLTALYLLHTEPAGDGVWRVHTEHTRGSWEEDGVTHGYDSAAPTPADPWPLTVQHLVASVPAEVRLSSTGVPEALVDPESWTTDARSALYGSTLPNDALASGAALLDVDGLLADLRRIFPGQPPVGQTWIRSESIAGVAAERREVCELEQSGKARSWVCSGAVIGPEAGPARLHEVESRTRILSDQRGLEEVETSYSGTLVLLDPSGAGVIDRPIAGMRRAERL